jgi:nucleotide-binding universal stress UspA family protein
MIAIQRILCPIDFSDGSRRALDYAVAIARWYESAVTALHVFSPAPIAAYGPGPVVLQPIVLTDADREELLREARRFVEAEAAPGVTVEVLLREGDATTEVLAQASAMDADLIVLGTHGRSGFERLVLGSVTEKVLRKASAPVLTVPPRRPDAVPPGPLVFKSVLCPIDFSEASMHALAYALSLAEEADGRLTVIHVVSHEFDNVADVANLAADEHMTIAEFKAARDRAIRERLHQALPETAAEYARVESLLTHGKPWREILRIAAERQSELIVMGVQGRGAADLMFFGSTTQHVVRAASCPVLTLRQP